MFISVDKFMIIIIYINDILIFRDNNKNIKKIQDSLFNWFKIINLEKILYYLNMKIDIDNNKTSIYQINYLKNVLKYFRFNDIKHKS